MVEDALEEVEACRTKAKPQVSILVVVEDALELIWTLLPFEVTAFADRQSDSRRTILVVVEDALEEWSTSQALYSQQVSILVVVEGALEGRYSAMADR